jgi:hypothetical protein
MTCVTFAGSDAGSKCAKYCNGNTDCTGNKLCTAPLSVPGTSEIPVVCQAPPSSCDLLLQDCPTLTDGCYLGPTGGVCFPAGSTADGQGCASGNACVKGSQCAGAQGAGTCRKICNTDGGTPMCNAGTCNPLSAPAPAGTGVCP